MDKISTTRFHFDANQAWGNYPEDWERIKTCYPDTGNAICPELAAVFIRAFLESIQAQHPQPDPARFRAGGV